MESSGEPPLPAQSTDEQVNHPTSLLADSRSRSTLDALFECEANSAPAEGSNQSDDAIARHCSLIQNLATHKHQDNCEQNRNDHDSSQSRLEQCPDCPPERPDLAMIQPLHRTLSLQSQAPSERSFRMVDGHLSEDQTAPCHLHDDHGPSAIEEEEAALQYSAELTAAKRASMIASSHSRASKLATMTLNNLGLSSELPRSVVLGQVTPPDCIEDEEEDDNYLSGLCIPGSKFFMTSVICSNTMTRDGLANERTFLAWLSVSVALSLVSFTFVTRSLNLDSLDPVIYPGEPYVHKDKLSLGIGYTCFIAAFLASIHNILRYLRNIRRISTRYPFAQEGKGTFTVGMILGTIIMVILVLSYTTRL